MALYIKSILGTVKMPASIILNSVRFSTMHCKIKRLRLNVEPRGVVCSIHTATALQKRRKTAEERKSQSMVQYPPKFGGEVINVWRNITIGELAAVLKRDVNYVSELFLGAIRGHNTVVTDVKELQNAIRRSGKRMTFIAKPQDAMEKMIEKDVFPRPPPSKSELKPRPPIITVMGHVDHGKTTLLDALRHSSVVEQEFGGITQHIGAFSVQLDSGARVTFLDTPGHAAFSAMRARGANLTDIIVLVVAADDGVMQQTEECIRMAREAKVPVLVAINKIDAPKANVERTEQMLMERGIQVERLGGDVQAVHISALKRINLEQLTEALVLQAELLEIGGDPNGPVEAVVVESRVDPHKGRLCTIVVQRGTLKKGDILIAGTAICRVRSIKDAQGQLMSVGKPGYPAEVEGWKDIPAAGELILQVESEKRAREVSNFRENKKNMAKSELDAVAIAAKVEEHLKEYKEKLQLKRRLGRFRLRKEGPRKPEIIEDSGRPSLNFVLKTDVDGTLEAILETLSTYDSSLCDIDIIHFGVGDVTENDIELAKTFEGIVYGFNVKCVSQNTNEEHTGVAVKHHNVIYKLVEAIKDDINSRLPLKQVEIVLGEATVLQQFIVTEGRKKVPIAGCRCLKGHLKRTASYRVIRNDNNIHEGPLVSMRYLKNEADTIKTDSECGLQFADKSILFEVGDKIICYENKMETQFTDWDPGF